MVLSSVKKWKQISTINFLRKKVATPKVYSFHYFIYTRDAPIVSAIF